MAKPNISLSDGGSGSERVMDVATVASWDEVSALLAFTDGARCQKGEGG
jgi:hypothetical protein